MQAEELAPLRRTGKRGKTGHILLALALVLCSFGVLRQISFQARLSSCRPQVILRICEAYAAAHEGQFPPLSPVPGMLMYDLQETRNYLAFYPEHLCEFDEGLEKDSRLQSYAYSHPLNDWSYVYLGYVLESEEQVKQLGEAYHRVMAAGGNFAGDIRVPQGSGNAGGDTLYRLRTPSSFPDAQRAIKDHADAVPIVIEWPGNHGRGGKVIYLSGRSEFLKYPSTFPMTEEVIATLRALDNYAPSTMDEVEQLQMVSRNAAPGVDGHSIE